MGDGNDGTQGGGAGNSSQLVANITGDADSSFDSAAPTNGASGKLADPETSAGTTAFIDNNATVDAGDDVEVTAKARVDYFGLTGGVQAGGIAIGGSITVANIDHPVSAFIDDGAMITTGAGGSSLGDINLEAEYASDADGLAFAGQASLVATFGAQVVVINDTSSQSARIEDATVCNAKNVNVTAVSNQDLDSQAVGVSVAGLGIAAGAAIVTTDTDGQTFAAVGAGADIGGEGPGRNLNVTSTANPKLYSESIAVSAGPLAATGSAATAAVNNEADAVVGANADIDLTGSGTTGSATVSSQIAPDAETLAVGVNAGIGTVGASVANTMLNPDSAATIDTNADFNVQTLNVSGNIQVPADGTTGKARATAASGSLVGINATTADVVDNSTAAVNMNDRVDIIASGTVTIVSSNNTLTDASVSGKQGALLAVGANFANTTGDRSTSTTFGDDVDITADTLRVVARGSSDAFSRGESGSGGLVSGTAVEGKTDNTSSTTASLGTGNSVISANRLEVTVDHLTKFDGELNSVNASAFGGSGAYSTHNIRGNSGADRVIVGLGDSDRITFDLRDPDPILLVSGNVELVQADVAVGIRIAEVHGDDGPNRIDARGVGAHSLRIFGHGGDDTLLAGAASELFGNNGNDELHGSAEDDWLDGGSGNDNLESGDGEDTLTGGPGNDMLNGGGDLDYRVARGNVDMVVENDGRIAALGTDLLADVAPLIGIISGPSANRIDASAFSSPLWIRGEGGNDTIIGGTASDTLDGGSGRDVLEGRQGNDVLTGSFGRDTLRGEAGNDRLFGQDDNDLLLGGSGNDVLDGGDGNDRIKGHSGEDTLGGCSGNDLLEGGPNADFRVETVRNNVTVTDSGITGVGTDIIVGELSVIAIVVDPRVRRGLRLNARHFSSPITLVGGAGGDTLTGSVHADMLIGGAGNDVLNARGGADPLFGEAGNDRLAGGGGSDGLNGGPGNDTLLGKGGVDRLAGGSGANMFDGDPSEIDELFGSGFTGYSPEDAGRVPPIP